MYMHYLKNLVKHYLIQSKLLFLVPKIKDGQILNKC
jgi:hypothetical protein